MLTFETCQKIIKRTLGADLPADLDVVRLVNNAGRFLTTLHRWEFLTRYGTVTRVDDQQYATMPTDFERLRAVPEWGDLVLELVDPQRLLDVRNDGGAVAPPDNRYLCAVFPTWPTAGGEVTYQLHFWPTPEVESGDEADIGIYYQAKWRAVTDDDETNNHVVTMPDHLEGLFEELLRIYARGIEEEDVAGLDERLTRFAAGIMVRKAIEVDGSVQPSMGPIRNGAVQAGSLRFGARFDRTQQLEDPS